MLQADGSQSTLRVRVFQVHQLEPLALSLREFLLDRQSRNLSANTLEPSARSARGSKGKAR